MQWAASWHSVSSFNELETHHMAKESFVQFPTAAFIVYLHVTGLTSSRIYDYHYGRSYGGFRLELGSVGRATVRSKAQCFALCAEVDGCLAMNIRRFGTYVECDMQTRMIHNVTLMIPDSSTTLFCKCFIGRESAKKNYKSNKMT